MGRKDSQTHSPPIDHYRKQIGKQNKKQVSSKVKELKKQTELKSSSSKIYKDVKVLVGGLAALVLFGYGVILLGLHLQSSI
ncbi:hypothetical protein Pcinc_038129 [Petrolisthes cinctipes]|uniref:Triple QxxK/R motif-containing protein n=1 Tax=Petrolisthes cinctipes TaxID=88211 RepID=A0AAE1ENC0_PETCI|nr:hypothetical protein Pcinc_038129 [Petrolisthes cinctipes]